jgi:hypothetical protein
MVRSRSEPSSPSSSLTQNVDGTRSRLGDRHVPRLKLPSRPFSAGWQAGQSVGRHRSDAVLWRHPDEPFRSHGVPTLPAVVSTDHRVKH